MSPVLPWHLHATLKMNCRLLIALALSAVLLNFAQSTFILSTGTAATATGLTLGTNGAALAAGAAVVGALAIGAVAAAALSRRGKREAAACLPFSSPEIYFSMAANSDFLDCGRRFVCELEATADDKLADQEILIRNLFGRSTSATSGPAGGFFAEAGALGATNGTGACAEAFRTCPFDRKVIYRAFTDTQNAA